MPSEVLYVDVVEYVPVAWNVDAPLVPVVFKDVPRVTLPVTTPLALTVVVVE